MRLPSRLAVDRQRACGREGFPMQHALIVFFTSGSPPIRRDMQHDAIFPRRQLHSRDKLAGSISLHIDFVDHISVFHEKTCAAVTSSLRHNHAAYVRGWNRHICSYRIWLTAPEAQVGGVLQPIDAATKNVRALLG